MRAKWRKIIWAILAVQLLLIHLMILQSWYVSYFLDRATYHLGLFRSSAINWSKLGLSFINWNNLAIMTWFCSGCVVMILYYLHYLRFRRACIRQTLPVSEPWILECMQEAIEETGLQKRYQPHFLYYNSDIREPFVIGFGKPVLLLPTQKYDREVLPLIFLHECYHIRHRDTLYKLFMIVMQSLLWFQPLMYLLKALSFRDIEVACDEAVIEGKDIEARKAYGMALLTCLEKERSKGQAYSAYFYHGAYLMRARMKAIMNENKRWDFLAVASILILLTEVLYSGYRIGDSFYISYLARHGEEIVSIYEGYDIPESFTKSAADSMLSLSPVSEDVYYQELQRVDAYENLSYEELPYQAEGPWQIRLTDADRYANALKPLLARYLYYYIDQEWATRWDTENYGSNVSLEVESWRLLAGSRENAVWAVICRKYVGNEEDFHAFPAELADRAQFVCEQGTYYAYFDWTVQVRMVKDYVFELEGVGDTREILTAFQDQYPQADYGDVPALDLVYSIDREDIIAGDRWKAHIDRDKNKVWVTDGDGVVREVTVPLSEVLDRGDEMEGKLTSLQPGSYQVDENKMIFGYGGDNSIPFSVVFYDEENGSFKKSVVTYDYFGGRKIFVDFPENSQEGFFIFTGERVVWQESALLFHTTDGGKSWQEIRPMGPDVLTQTHSLTIGAGFISNEVGFITMRSSEPEIWRTEDGGIIWSRLVLPYVPEYYSMAYMPEEKDGVLTLYVGMEEYAEYAGTKAKYVSTDDGNIWEYQGIVLRK